MNKSGRLGAEWETAIVNLLLERGWKYAERRRPAGKYDRGDITGVRGVVIEAKNTARFEPGSFVDQAIHEANNAVADFGIAFVKRRGKGPAQGYAITDIDTMLRMLRRLNDLGGL